MPFITYEVVEAEALSSDNDVDSWSMPYYAITYHNTDSPACRLHYAF